VNHTTLVSAATLAEHLNDPGWIVFDCRHNLTDPDAGHRSYLEAHIPGARFLHLDHDLSGPLTGHDGRHPLADAGHFAARLATLGMGPTLQAVAYDDAGGAFAARLWWMLRWIGHDQVALLDGGLQKWILDNHPVTHALPAIRPAGEFHPRPSESPVDAPFLLARLNDEDTLIIDARTPERFRGIGETLDPVGGHIPGAVNRFFRENLDESGCFKEPEALRTAFQQLVGSRDPRGVVHQCGSGVTACHNLLAMEIAGIPGSRLYPGSWSEWCADPARPIER
jgi:thiosulfate/3-mercaptopyruvate sulfurtransferase